jgi:sulfur carrier protein
MTAPDTAPSAAITITVTINGEPREVPAALDVTGLLKHLQVEVRAVAVERNRRVVRRVDHNKTSIEAGDVIEIVSFVGGG